MNSTRAQFLTRRLPKGAARLCRLISATLCLFLLTAVPALADTVSVNQVVQTLSSSQAAIDLRLKTLQDPATKGGTQNGPRADGTQGTQGQGGTKTEPIISGVTITSEGQQLGIEYIEEGDVEGTICDCGEIMIAGAGAAFPKWPFLFLGAVPLIFIDHGCDNCDQVNESTPTPTPPTTPTPPPPPGVPEPGSLVLFGTGLAAAGAGLRRRYAKMKIVRQMQEEE